tara:strand:+ start:315 stop:566 length:252 start_codon:yes stop_codon:yes gene_type:complete
MRLLESYDLMNEEVEWETDRCLMTNMIQVNDCLADTKRGVYTLNVNLKNESKLFFKVTKRNAETKSGRLGSSQNGILLGLFRT